MRATTFVSATAWGSWIVTSPSSNYAPSGTHRSLDFLVRYESQADTVHCGAYFPGTAERAGPDQPYAPCDDEAVSFTSDLSIGTMTDVWISQRLYQRSAIVTLKGTAPLYLYGRNCTTNAIGGGTCSGPPFNVPVTSVSIQLANGTIVDNDSTSSEDNGAQGNDAGDGNEDGGQDDDQDDDQDGDQDDGNSTDDYSSSGATTSTGDADVQGESITSGDDGSSDKGSSYDDGAPYGNTTVLNNGHGSGNTTWHGSHGNGTRRGHYA
ncbi:hypothetical protein UCDDS831_g07103 [Diplodia seriata]|uniref:Uncharacterized protein n=1 Tax=Diplodia seriata TaxID=420778 RepID=A0A0G2E0N9_9PEZI|nr:hypothetical protein UCDDS831_g07103 [Diplodia seriata]